MRSPRRQRLAAAVAAVAAVASGLVGATSAPAISAPAISAPAGASPGQHDRVGSCTTPRCFGAISFNKRTGVAGLANDKDGRPKSIRLAQRSCRAHSADQSGFPGQCVPAGSVQNGCMAVAFRVVDNAIVEWTTEFGHTKHEAVTAARASVAGPGDRYAVWLCTTRHYA